MVSAKVLAPILIVDALVATWIFVMNNQLLTWWLVANAVMVVLFAAIFLRRKPMRKARKPSRASFADHQKMHGMEHETLNGELVKSGGERMIADHLFKNKIRYEYEKPAKGRSNRTISRPDFYLPDYDVYIEYWGMVDTQDGNDRKEYVRSMKWKMGRYRENDIRVVSIYPDEIERLESVFARKLKGAIR